MGNHERHTDVAHFLDLVELVLTHILAMDQVWPDFLISGLLASMRNGVERQVHGRIAVRVDSGCKTELQDFGHLLVELFLRPACALFRVGIQFIVGLGKVPGASLGGAVCPGLDVPDFKEISLVVFDLRRDFVQARHGDEHPAINTHRKFTVASDFFHKYGRKSFTIIGTIIGALGFILIGFTDQFFSIYTYTILLFVGHTGIGFLDAAADAWAIDISTKEDRGKINASMNIGKSVGGALGGPILVVLAISFGYNISFLITGIVILLLAIIPLMVKYVDRKIDKINIWSLIKQEFSYKATRFFTTYQFLASNPIYKTSAHQAG